MAVLAAGPFGDELTYDARLTDFVLDPVTGDVFSAAEDGRVFRIDPVRNSVTEIANVGGVPGGIDISSDGQTLIVAQTELIAGTVDHRLTVHTIDLATGTVTDTLFDPDLDEAGTFDVAAVAPGALLTTRHDGSGLAPFRALDTTDFSLTEVIAPNDRYGEVYGRSFVTPSEDDRYVFLQEANTSLAPMSIYDVQTGTFVAATTNRQTPGGGYNHGGADISSAGFVYNPNYGAIIYDFSFQVVQDFSDRGYLSIAFSDDGDLIYALTPDARIDIIETTDWVTVQALNLVDLIDEAVEFHWTGEGFDGVYQRISSYSNDDVLILERPTHPVLFDGDEPQAFLLDLKEARSAYVAGTDEDDVLSGTPNINFITGLSGNDTLNGRTGDDTLDGGPGDDRFFVDSEGDVVIEASGQGTDNVTTSVDYTLPDNVEQGSSSGSGDIRITGNALANFISGNGGDNTLLGLAGADRLRGGTGNDTLEGGEGNDILEGQGGENLFVMGPDNGDDQVLDWQPGIDLLDVATNLGLRFADLRLTSSGNEALISFDDPAGGTGSVRLIGIDPESIEIDILSDPDGPGDVPLLAGTSAGENLAGTALAEDLIGLAGNDALNGRAGDDTMLGGFGDDRYFLDDAGDLAIEFAFQGIDQVDTRFSMILPDHVERGAVRGGGAVDITGNALDNFMTGSDLENVLIGGDGRDRLIARAGNDTLDGGLDRDVLEGGAGSDVFVFGLDSGVDLITDFVVGEDLIDVTALNIAFADMTIVDGALGALVVFDSIPGSVDLVTLQGVAAADLRLASFMTVFGENQPSIIGTEGNDVLFGTVENDGLQGLGGDDQLDGQSGADILAGGLGDDRYFVDDPGDIVAELPGEGTDQVTTSIDYILPENVENLNTNTTTPVNLTGNALDNLLNGNDAANTITGLAGDDNLQGKAGEDLIIGGTGDDILRGGAQADTFVFASGDGSDTIVDFEVGIDTIDLIASGLTTQDLVILEEGGNVVIPYGSDQITVLDTTAAQLDYSNFDFGLHIISGDFSGVVIEDSATPVLSATGRIAFTDIDLHDGHTVNVQSVSRTHHSFLGNFSATIIEEATGDGVGEIEWSYSVDNGETQFLAEEEAVLETYVIAVLDDAGNFDYTYIQVTITGAADSASIEGANYGAVFEDGYELGSAKLTASDGQSHEGFGWSSAISTDSSTLVIGKPGDNGFGSGSGSAYLFNQKTEQIAKLVPSDISAGDSVGGAVAVSSDGQTIIVGAKDDDDNGRESGSVYVFDQLGIEVLKIKPTDGSASEYFGESLSISGDGNLIVVGAPEDDDNGFDSGSAYIFDRSGLQLAKLTASDGDNRDNFGHSVAISGDGAIIAIGTPDDYNNFLETGSVYIFDNTGNEIAKLIAGDGEHRDSFGADVSISSDGETIMVGAPGGNAVYLFDQAGEQLAKLAPSGDYVVEGFGWRSSASEDGSIIVVTALTDFGRGVNEGSAYVFDRSGEILAKLSASDGGRDSGFGSSASISGDGDVIVIGAGLDDEAATNSGAAYTFQRNGDGHWVDFAGNIYGPSGIVGSQSLDLKQAAGTLTVLDPDAAEAEFQPIDPGTPGDNGFGVFQMGSDGNWQYTLDNDLLQIQELDEGDVLFDSILVHSLDGTASQQIQIEIAGADEGEPDPITLEVSSIGFTGEHESFLV